MTRTDQPAFATLNSTDNFSADLQAIGSLYPREMIDNVAAIRANARLEQILATDPATTDPGIAPERQPRRQNAWRWALIPAAAAIALGVVLAQPANTAFASWTAEPEPLTEADIAQINTVCRTLDQPFGPTPNAVYGNPGDMSQAEIEEPQETWVDPTPMRPMAESPTVIDRRGEWAMGIWTNPADEQNPWGQTVTCLTRLVNGQWEFEFGRAQWGPGGPGGADPLPTAAEQFAQATPLGPDDVEYILDGFVRFDGDRRNGAGDMNQARGNRGFTSMRDWEGDPAGNLHGTMVFAIGRVGEDVGDLTVHIPSGDVQASVENGWFIVWWPEGSARQAVARTEGYTVTTRDGTVLPRVNVDWSEPWTWNN